MIICKKCGRQNEDKTEFCRSCGSFLEWTGQELEKPVSSLILTVTPAVIAVEPGQEATSEVRIQNTGSIVDGFVVELSDEVRGWASVEPGILHVFPGREEAARITFRPPRSPGVGAGPRPFTVRARSSVTEGDKVFEQHCHITVGRFTDLQATIAPKTSEALDSGVHTLMLGNRGNAQAEVRLRGIDPDERLMFEFEPDSHVIEPGGSAATRLKVSRRPGVSRPDQRFPFQIEVTPIGEPAVLLDAALVQLRPAVVRRWAWQPWAIAVAAVALLALVGALYALSRSETPKVALPPGGLGSTTSPNPPPTSPAVKSTTPSLAAPSSQSAPTSPATAPVAGPLWTGWAALPSGGTTNVAAATTVYAGRLYLFGIGINDHGHYVNVFDGSTWTGWAQMARGLPSTVSDAAVVYNGKLYVFGISVNDQHHYVDVFDGTNWNGWNQVPGGGTSSVSDAAAAYNGKLYLFGIGINDHRHYVNVFDGSAWSGWSAVPGSGTTTSSDAVTVYDGSLYLFSVSGGTHNLDTFDGSSWSGWRPVPGGGATNDSEAAVVFAGKLYLFGIGVNDRGQYVNVFDGSNWTGWAAVPGGVTSRSFDAAGGFNDKLYVFEIGQDQHYYFDILSS